MPDTPVNIEGNSQKLRIRLPEGDGPRTFEVDSSGKGTLTLDPNATSLQLHVANGEGLNVTLPLGSEWSIRIDKLREG